MPFLNRTIMVLFIILLSLVSGAYGITISGSTSDAHGISGFTESLDAGINDRIQENIILTGSSLSQTFQGSGNKAETFSVTNTVGDHADTGFNITNSISYSGAYSVSPEDVDYAQADMSLDVDTADSINAFANARSREGVNAGSSVLIKHGSLIGYKNSAYSTSGHAKTNQEANFAIGDSVRFYGGAWDKESNSLQFQIATGKGILSKGSLQGYNNSVDATSTQLSGNQHADFVDGNWYTQDLGVSYKNDYSAGSFGWGQGYISNYNGTSGSIGDTKTSTASADKISGDMSLATNSYLSFLDPTHQYASSSISVSNGVLNSYSNSAKTGINEVGAIQNSGSQTFASAIGYDTGSQVILKANAENRNLAEEGYDLNRNHIIDPSESYPVDHGGADFEVRSKDLGATSITGTATNNKVLITTELPAEIKKAIVLEPYYRNFTARGDTDFGSSSTYGKGVIPILLENEYAVLRYTDSGASEDKFIRDLDKYNIVLINSHMDPDQIALSTKLDPTTKQISAERSLLNPGEIKSFYDNPPDDAMVLLIGCSSFGSDWFGDLIRYRHLPEWDSTKWDPKNMLSPNKLSKSFGKADMIFGFEGEVNGKWAGACTTTFFNQLDSGETAYTAQAYANSNSPYINKLDYWSEAYYLQPRLEFDGNIIEQMRFKL